MSQIIQIVTTTGSQGDAEQLARALVDQRLAACVQIVGPIASVYRWQGKVETASEWQCLAKTRRDLFDRVAVRIRQLHAYETPEIIAVPVELGLPEYLDWLQEQVS